MGTLLDRERFRRDHRWSRRRMSEYLDGDLAPARRMRMERHLGECVRCRQLLAGLRQIVHGLQRLPAPSADVDGLQLAASVRTRLSEVD